MFVSKQILPSVWQIAGYVGEVSYLLTGTRGALLFDTQGGIADLRGEVARLTGLPVTVVNSHCHYDHVGGNWQFDHAWMNEADWEAGSVLHDRAFAAYLVERIRATRRNLTEAEAAPILNWTFDGYLPLAEGRVFDLGGLTAEAIALPGHTAGSMGLWIPEREILLTGDAMTPIMCMFFPESLDLDTCVASMRKARTIPFQAFYTGHHTRPFTKRDLADMIACAEASRESRGMQFASDVLQFPGRLYIYRGEDSEADDFLAYIGKPVPRKRRGA